LQELAAAELKARTVEAEVHPIDQRTDVEKLVDEIDTFAKAGKLSDPIAYSESLTMPYFFSCVKEALRLHCPVGYLLPRYVPEGGRTITSRYFTAGVIRQASLLWACMDYSSRCIHFRAGAREIYT
jgi:Cytochrome P450